MKKILNDFLHLVYPEVCVGCGTDTLSSGQMLCISCHNSLPETGFFRHKNNPVEEKFFGRAKITHAGSAYFFEKKTLIQRLLHELKYKQNKDCGRFMGTLLANELEKSSWISEIDLVIPIPLSKKRKAERGYNQSMILAEPIAEKFLISAKDNAVIRIVNTETQTHKNREERWNSMQNIFKIENRKLLNNKHILVIDDVLTTGATTEVLCNVLLHELDCKVSVATFACTI